LSAPGIFDAKHYERYNSTRAAATGDVLSELQGQLQLRTAIDVGCGFGYMSAFLHSLGLRVTAVDGRNENIQEARRRSPDVHFETANAEGTALRSMGRFDLVLCFGLLYHLENPFLAIRNLHALTSELLLIESMVFPGSEPVMGLVDEPQVEDQSLNCIAFYPTEACLVKMLYNAGFPNVYLFKQLPDHPDFRTRDTAGQSRTMLAASLVPLLSSLLERMQEPRISFKPRIPDLGEKSRLMEKLRRFAAKPLSEKIGSVKRFLGAG
jgi:SAM-dependent methyltransferase